MAQIRKRLSWLVAGWLVVQCLAPLSAHVAMAISTDEAACVCPPGTMAGAKCPMHQKHEAEKSASRCAVRSAGSFSDAVFMSLMTPGMVPPSQASVDVPNRVEQIALNPLSVINHPTLPDFPPPRA